MKTVIKKLIKLDACREAVKWVEGQKSKKDAWNNCERGDWMSWLLGRLAGKPESKSRKKLVSCCCECVRLSLTYIPKEERRPLKAIETAEAYVRGEATLDEVKSAADAAAAYAADVAYAAYAAYAAYDTYAAAYVAYAAAAYVAYAAAAYVAYAAAAAAAYAAAAYAAYVAYAAKKDILKQCADIVRKHYPKAPEF